MSVWREREHTRADSVIYVADKDHNLNDMMGEAVGELKDEIPEGWRMTEFVGPGLCKVFEHLSLSLSRA